MEEDMRRVLNSKFLAAAGLASALATFLPAGAVSAATTINDPTVASCLPTYCSAESITGTIGSHGSYAFPWEIQVGSDPGQCVRLETTSVQGGLDLEMVVVSPSGRLFRDNDGGVGNLSLVKIAPTEQGWYTVQVSAANGGAALVNFTLSYGRYSSFGNPNCATATPPL
jgi:hypothetical protein